MNNPFHHIRRLTASPSLRRLFAPLSLRGLTVSRSLHRLAASLSLLCIVVLSRGQTPDSLIHELKAINRVVVNAVCSTGRGDLVSNRAMNIFLSEKVGYYLSSSDNLTLYKNSVVANAAEGTLAIYHNLNQATGIDDRLRSFLSIGAKANVADAFAANYAGRQYSNQFGLLVKQTWIGKARTSFNPCANSPAGNLTGNTPDRPAVGASQKLIMDALRAGILHSLETEINTRSAEFERSLDAMDAADVPGQSLEAAKTIARQKFNTDLRQEYEYKFALLQSEALSKGFNYKVVAVNWTSISLYLPVITENFETAASLATPLGTRHAYPLHANITHTWLWETSQSGRFFLSIAGDAFLNNSKDGYGLYKTSFADYKSLGGADTVHAASFRSNVFYIGDYKSFITPALKGQFVYFPPDSHIGISFLLEQHFGTYKALNGVLGVPIVLINKKAIPAVDFEFQVRFFDLSNKIGSGNGLPGKTSVGLSVGIPFSKIAY
ncbi:MAG TPA: hypothetical protein VK563_10955 [Puia sp.]|nr:hypothetical protein [Puia sp.]